MGIATGSGCTLASVYKQKHRRPQRTSCQRPEIANVTDRRRRCRVPRADEGSTVRMVRVTGGLKRRVCKSKKKCKIQSSS